MRKLAAAALAALFTTGAALAATAPAYAADPACTGTIGITSMTWSPPEITPGQGSLLTLVAQNCTDTPRQVSLVFYARYLGADPGSMPPGCPVIDPLAPRQITIAAGGTYTETSGYSTFTSCTANRLQVTAQFSIDGTRVASRSADLAIAPPPPRPQCAVTYRTMSRWDGGFVAEVTIADIATTPINGWTLHFDFRGDQRITGAWSATTAQTGTAVVASNEAWNAAISPGGTATFGILGTWHDSDAPPTAFTVNGAPCEVR